MPELPEVQTTVNGIVTYVKGLSITDVWTGYNSKFHKGKGNIHDPAYFSVFKKSVKGSRITNASRRGKNILIHLSNDKTILIHMKMTGHVMYGKYKKLAEKDFQGEMWRPADPRDPALNDPFNRFLRVVFSLSDGKHLVLSDMRKFAKVTMIDTKTAHKSSHLSTHGPEPLEKSFDLTAFKKAVMKKPMGRIKTVLMDPTVISGIGNIYSDEILWRAGVHPMQHVKEIASAKSDKWPVMYKAMRETLLRGIDFGGDSMSDYRNILGLRGKFQDQHKAYRKTGTKCSKPKCRGTIVRLKIGGRSAHFCDTHQKLYT